MVGNEEPTDRGPPDIAGARMEVVSQAQKRALNSEETHNPKSKRTTLETNPITASKQQVYTHPSLASGLREYSNNDIGPFIVHISKEVTDPAATTSIRAIKIGQLLVNNCIKDITQDGVKKVGRNRISVEFTSAESANNFLKNPVIQNNNFSATIPTYNCSRMGLVRNVPADISMEVFAESIEVPQGFGMILKARRLNRKNRTDSGVEWIPTNSVVLTFQGQKLPERIYSFHNSLPIELYQLPTIQCLKCCRFGHVRDQCRSKPRCFRCAQSHTGDECSVVEPSATCIFCSRTHFATYKNCSEHIRQQNIKNLMSKESISFQEASLRFPTLNRLTYADATAEVHSNNSAPQSHRESEEGPSPTNISYRKTVTYMPRPRTPLDRGYDRHAHQDIIRPPPSSSANGRVFQKDNSQHEYEENSPNENLLDILVSLILNILNKFDSLPPNVAPKFEKFFTLINQLHGSPPSNNTVE